MADRDKQAVPLSNRRNRNYGTAPFKGQEGKPHPRLKRLEARQKAYDDLKNQQGRKRPGSVKK